MSDELSSPFEEVLSRIRTHLVEARRQALTVVNAVMVQAYWSIGREIVEVEQKGEERAEFGTRLMETLSERLTKEFGKGFDASNLRYMRLFYLAFPIRDALRHELSWTHYRTLLKLDSDMPVPVSATSMRT